MTLRRWPPWVFDLAAVVLAFTVSMVALDGREDVRGLRAGTGELVATVALCLPLVWRRRAPVAVFACTAALSWLLDLGRTDVPAGLFAPLVAVYAVARHRPRAWLWPVVTVFVSSGLIKLLQHELMPQDITAMGALLAATVFLGMNLRTRRAYLHQLEERAARLERERDQQAQLAAAAERARIARELHDIVAHNLTVMVALAEGAAATVPTAPERAVDVMGKVAGTGRLALVEMRRMVGVLRADGSGPGARAPQPGLGDIDPLVEQVRAAGLRVELTRSGEPGAWGPGAGLAVYRIVQEALTNTLKHAGPRAVARVRVRYSDDGADIEVDDDGAGRPAVKTRVAGHGVAGHGVAGHGLDGHGVAGHGLAGHGLDGHGLDGHGLDGHGLDGHGVGGHGLDGHGLAGMAERAASFGGRLEAGPGAGAGWRVRASLRFHPEGRP